MSVKVKNIEHHYINDTVVPVVRGKLVFLGIPSANNHLFEMTIFTRFYGKFPIIISEIEAPLEGERCITPEGHPDTFGMDYRACYTTEQINSCKKILVFHDQLSPTTVREIVDEKIKEGDEVFIQCEQECQGYDVYFVIKTNSFNFAFIHPISKTGVEATLGVGTGDTNLFVHGSYEAIKAVQEKLLKLEKLERTIELLNSLLPETMNMIKELNI